ncbi:MAG TPA: cupin domain-containing protein [Gammaproteobacteria bacterium]|nr:cupin domain-containing protein [Gammaproteobacteria bacterium]
MGPRIVKPGTEAEFETEERCAILESWNDPRDPGASIARARVRPGVRTRLHLLVDTQERYLIVHGQGEVRVGTLAPTLVGPGDVVVIPPEIPQQITNTGKDDLIFYAICTPRFEQTNYRDVDPEPPAAESR